MSKVQGQRAVHPNVYLKSIDGRSHSLQSIISALARDPEENGRAKHRVVATHDPSLCLFHLLAGWLKSQNVVFAGTLETAHDMLANDGFIVAKDVLLTDR